MSFVNVTDKLKYKILTFMLVLTHSEIKLFIKKRKENYLIAIIKLKHDNNQFQTKMEK